LQALVKTVRKQQEKKEIEKYIGSSSEGKLSRSNVLLQPHKGNDTKSPVTLLN
jgi:hypothetical protein